MDQCKKRNCPGQKRRPIRQHMDPLDSLFGGSTNVAQLLYDAGESQGKQILILATKFV
ncbi:hypothetical protein CHS0354_028449, partial [Potamilus streckersoni]